jgi:hypothetical protein
MRNDNDGNAMRPFGFSRRNERRLTRLRPATHRDLCLRAVHAVAIGECPELRGQQGGDVRGERDLARNAQLAARMRDPIGLEFSGR